MNKELHVRLSIYLEMNEGETEEEAYERFKEILDNIKDFDYQDYEHEVNEW